MPITQEHTYHDTVGSVFLFDYALHTPKTIAAGVLNITVAVTLVDIALAFVARMGGAFDSFQLRRFKVGQFAVEEVGVRGIMGHGSRGGRLRVARNITIDER